MTATPPNRPTNRRYMEFVAPQRQPSSARSVAATSQQIIIAQSTTTVQRPSKPLRSPRPAPAPAAHKPQPQPRKPQPKPAPEPDFGVVEDYHPSSQPARADAPDANQYSLGGKSPFLASVNVDKRPLSPSAPSHPSKNVYQKAAVDAARASVAHTTVVPAAKDRSKLPMIALIILTVLLGAAVGAAAYLTIFQ